MHLKCKYCVGRADDLMMAIDYPRVRGETGHMFSGWSQVPALPCNGEGSPPAPAAAHSTPHRHSVFNIHIPQIAEERNIMEIFLITSF